MYGTIYYWNSIMASRIPALRITTISTYWNLLLNRQLDLGQPIFFRFLVPDTIDVAFPGRSSCVKAVLLRIPHEEGIGFTDTIIGSFVKDAQHLRGRQSAEVDLVVFFSRRGYCFAVAKTCLSWKPGRFFGIKSKLTLNLRNWSIA